LATAAVGGLALALVTAVPAAGAKSTHQPKAGARHAAATGASTFSTGQLQAQTVGAPGCGTNDAGEPAIHVSKDNLVGLGSERGLGGGSQFWGGTQVGGTAAASACQLTYDGQPNAVAGFGASGGDVDEAIAPVKDPATSTYRIYVASLNLASINVATSEDNGKTFNQVPVVGGLPGDDREWIAAHGPSTALLTYHDIVTDNIDVLRSDDGGKTFVETSRAIDDTDPNSSFNELGNIVIDHNFPNVSVAPNGTLFYAVSNDKNVYVAMSSDHGDTWSCSGPVSSSSQAIFPWIVATSAGEDLVYYGATGSGASQLWSVYFAQNLTQSLTGWSTTKVVDVHKG
ncbi:MAG TPA: hypothetical protein VKJ07_02860, partial [Mycobacteriales bacterium]|nr:hypothetical protein [Mycobacteriales bacterium]